MIDNLTINKRLVTTARLVQTSRQGSGLVPPTSGPGLGRSPSSASANAASSRPPIGGGGGGSSFKKAPPPPPPSSSSVAAAAPPPPYTAASASALGTKRAPPPIPATKPKPKPPVSYVVALYDFAAQVPFCLFLHPLISAANHFCF